MKRVTRIPVQADSMLIQAVRLFDELRQRGTDAALIVPDAVAADAVKKALSLTDKHVLNASMPRHPHWIIRRVFPVYVIADEAQCADAVHRIFPGEGQFIHLLASRQKTFANAHVYAFTEAKARHQHRHRVTTDTRQDPPSVLGPSCGDLTHGHCAPRSFTS